MPLTPRQLPSQGAMAATQGYRPASLNPEGAVFRTPYEEGSGSVAADSIGSADGDIIGATWVSSTTTTGGYYLSVDGVDDLVDYGTPAVLDLDPSGSWTIEIGFREPNDNSSHSIIFGKYSADDATHQYTIRLRNGDNFHAYVGDSQSGLTGRAPSGSWEVIHLRNDAGSCGLFVDGENLVSWTAGTTINSASTTAGASDNQSGYIDGEIDDPIVYDYALSDSEISDKGTKYQ